LPYTEDDLEQDVQAIRKVLAKEWLLSPIPRNSRSINILMASTSPVVPPLF
jgi:hypothetical protein